VNDAPPRVWELTTHAFPALLDACGGSLEGLRVLDVACNCGGFSVEASKQGADYVLGVDAVDRYIEQASFVKRVLGLDNVEFRKRNVYDLDAEEDGIFDVTLCFGLLYHLENPVLAMRKLGSITRRVMVVDTRTLPMPAGDRRPLWRMSEAPEAGSVDNPGTTTNLWRDRNYVQFVPTNSAVRRLLRSVGFDQVRRIKLTARGLSKTYYSRKRATFIAVREG
jgi:SAM-dependent methyltransferase